jgi:hypothetical protein
MNQDLEPLINRIIEILQQEGFTCYPAQTMPNMDNEVTNFVRGKEVITIDVLTEADEAALEQITQEEDNG